MAYFYIDAATGTDSLGNGGSWAAACASLIYLLDTATTNPAAGDTIFIRANSGETTKDTTAASITIVSAGTAKNPIKAIGVKTGTTNEGASVVASDISTRGVDQPVLEVTGAGNDINITGSIIFIGIHKIYVDRIYPSTGGAIIVYVSCVLAGVDKRLSGAGSIYKFIDCEFSSRFWFSAASAHLEVSGGAYTGTSTYLIRTSASQAIFTAVDLSTGSLSSLSNSGSTVYIEAVFRNCKMPVTISKYVGSQTSPMTSVTLIGCSSNTSAKGATSSYPDYEYEDLYGTVDLEATVVRTGGADDGASGAFSYAMTPNVDATLEGSQAALKSPWMAVWLEVGANTLTTYIANDTASTDFNEDEVWVEFYTPDSGDTAQHNQNFDPDNARLLDSTTAITDDTGSTWGTGGNNHQKLTTTVTTGFEGVAYARLHFAKRYASSPDTLYLDPEIGVS